MSGVSSLPEPTQAEVNALVEVISDAKLRGIAYGPWPLARRILAAGYRKVPDPLPPRYGECRACAQPQQLTGAGVAVVVEHEDSRRGAPCIGSWNTPLREVQPPDPVGA